MYLYWGGPFCQSLHEIESCPVFFKQSATPSVPLSDANLIHRAQGFWYQISSVCAVIWQCIAQILLLTFTLPDYSSKQVRFSTKNLTLCEAGSYLTVLQMAWLIA